MSRVGILTLHYGSNHGAILQSLAGTRLFDGEVIDHRYRTKLEAYTTSNMDRDYLQAYIDSSLPMSRQFLSDNFAEGPTLEFIKGHYDLLVFGSDELWKLFYSGPSRRLFFKGFLKSPFRAMRDYSWAQYDKFYTPFPNIYWPSLDIPSVAFAGSIGGTKTERIPERHRARMAASLERFQMMGLRDSKTLDFFSSLRPDLADRLVILPDPVFTFEASDEDRRCATEVLESHGIDTTKPFVYLNVSNQHRERCAREVESLGMQSINLLDIPLTPPQWFAAIGLANCGISSAMHGFISALVQGTPCLSIDPRFKSQELREQFGVSDFETLVQIMDGWPKEEVATEARQRAERVRAFVQEAQGLARRSAA